MNDTIVKWMYEVLNTRIETSMGIEYVFVKATRGKPQNGVIYHFLCSLVVNELLQRLTELGFECVGYANDIVLMIRDKFEGNICDLLHEALRIIEQWCLSVGLNIKQPRSQ